MALAEVGDGTGSLTITAVAGNEGMTYSAYKIFTCDVDPKGGTGPEYVATSIDWANDAMKSAVESAIRTYDGTYAGSTAQDAADYIVSVISGGSGVRVGANGLAENLVKAIDDTSATATLTAGTASTLSEGYYLIVSDPSSVSGAKVGTSPIFTMLGAGQTLTISEKTSVPTITKTASETADASGGSYIDAQAGQAVEFADDALYLNGEYASELGSADYHVSRVDLHDPYVYAYAVTGTGDAAKWDFVRDSAGRLPDMALYGLSESVGGTAAAWTKLATVSYAEDNARTVTATASGVAADGDGVTIDASLGITRVKLVSSSKDYDNQLLRASSTHCPAPSLRLYNTLGTCVLSWLDLWVLPQLEVRGRN